MMKLFSGMNAKIRFATLSDIDSMVTLSRQKRLTYEKDQPVFWRHAEQAEESQTQWFLQLLERVDHILLIAECDKKLNGFIIGRIMKAPEVYDPGGLTLMIDDFCVKNSDLWQTIGYRLLLQLKQVAKQKGAIQVVAVCGNNDAPKVNFLEKSGLKVASKWFVGNF